MKLKFTFLAASLSLSMFTNAQQLRRCASDDYLKQLDMQYPGFEQSVKSLSNQISNDPNKKTRAETITVPVVVHIVYKNATENLTDDYVTAQIDILNKSFLRQNADTTGLRTEFKPFAGKANIQFMLAQTIRKSTTVPEFTYSGSPNGADVVKVTAAGGSDAISPDKKLNIWVCDLGGGGGGELLGYAYPPPGLPNWGGMQFPTGALDGVVIDFMAFGGTSKLPKGNVTWGCKGKTAVHEVAHYLGLRHIWGDDNGACQGDVGFEDDGIGDTPHAGDMSNSDCNKNKNTCNQGAGDLKDMVENYMDYSAESCQNTFTKQQVSLMESVLNNQRLQIRIPLKIDDYDFSSNVAVFPNPADDVVNVGIMNLNYTTAEFSLMNHLGQTIQAEKTDNSRKSVTFDVRELPTGIYFLKIVIDGKYAHNEKVLIQ
ncbi:MAG: zinc-dependent metalloprotease [Chitinophagaceae bacterium]|nr:zinc-dependent metalloprotease [Chitinophagaceae bacterium]